MPAAVEAPDVHGGGPCGAVDVIEMPEADRPRVSLAAQPKVDAIVVVPVSLASIPPDEAGALAAVAEVRTYESLSAAARGEFDGAATATLFPALRASQAAHEINAWSAASSSSTPSSWSSTRTARSARSARWAIQRRPRAARARWRSRSASWPSCRRRLDEAREVQDRHPPAKGRCADNPLAAAADRT